MALNEPDFDLTRKIAERLLDEHAAMVPGPTIERRVREAQAKHPRAHVHWDDELQDVVTDLSSGGT